MQRTGIRTETREASQTERTTEMAPKTHCKKSTLVPQTIGNLNDTYEEEIDDQTSEDGNSDLDTTVGTSEDDSGISASEGNNLDDCSSDLGLDVNSDRGDDSDSGVSFGQVDCAS